MGTETLATYSSTGITLTTDGAYQTPFTITQAGTVEVMSGHDVYSTVAGAVLLNEGCLLTSNAAVALISGGTVTNAAGGTITGQFGVQIGSSDNGGIASLSNAGLIMGQDTAVDLEGAAISVANTGTIYGAGMQGIYARDGGYISNAGTVGGHFGVDLVDRGSAMTLDNTGTIEAQYTGIAAQFNVVVVNQGLVRSAGNGVQFTNASTTLETLVNYGTITGVTAVDLSSPGDLLDAGSAAQSLFNAGLIIGSNNGVYIRGSISNFGNNGTIAGQGDGLYFVGGGYISNAGTLAGAYGVHWVDDPGTVLTLNNTGTIYGTSRGVKADDDGNTTISNAKLIDGRFMGIEISNSGVPLDTVINTGTITSEQIGIFSYTLGNTAIFNAGTIEGGNDGVWLENSGTSTNMLFNTGAISSNFDGVFIYVASTGGTQTIINRGTISGQNGISVQTTAASGTTIENSGTIASTLGAAGNAIGTVGSDTSPITLIVDPGAVFIGHVTGAGGVLEFAAGAGSLGGIGDQFFDFATYALDTGAVWTVSGALDTSADEVVTGFTRSDIIDITNLTVPSDSLVTLSGADVLSVTEGADTLNLTFSGDTGAVFTLTSDGGGGTLIEEVTCFLRGTRIATPRGEVAVENLAIGDAVRTLHAGVQKIKWIGTRLYTAPFCNHAKVLPIHIRADAIADGVPARDLFVSPGHAICIDDALIHAARLVNGVSITQVPRAEVVEYFHIELAHHEVIFAENCPAETFMGEYFRKQFQNAESFSALYPGGKAPEIISVPFLSHGFQLGAILRRLRARAGLTPPATPGPLRGYIDAITPTAIFGWAQDLASPDEPVLLDILADELRLGRALANIPRPDVAAAGFGRGEHGFEFALPAGTAGTITVRRAADGAALARTTQSQAA